jgi:CRISPR/Cas system-associated exonuclease Cas4 (RecB family)
MPELLAYIDACEPTSTLTERHLVSKDGRIGGTVDLIVLGQRPCIVDYKTGLVLEDGSPSAHFVRQLSLYAHLVEEELGIDVRDAALFSLRQGMVSIDVSRPARDSIVRECLLAQERFNALVPGEQPAIPSSEACSYCPFVGICDEFWELEQVGGRTKLLSGVCLEGRVNAEPVLSSSGQGALSVVVELVERQETVTMFDIPNGLIESIRPDERLRVWRLREDQDAQNVYRWKQGQSGLVVTN